MMAIYACGIIPYNALDYMPYKTEMIRRVCRKLVSEGVLTMTKVDKKKVLTLAPWSKETQEIAKIEDLLPYGYREYYHTTAMPDKHRVGRKGEIASAERVISNVDAVMFTHYSGIGSYFDEKPKLSELKRPAEGSIYYSLRDIREVYDLGVHRVQAKGKHVKAGANAVSTSRANGIILTSGKEAYIIYAIGRKAITWYRTGEMNFQGRMRRLADDRGYEMNDECIIFHDGNTVIDKIFNFEKTTGRTTMNVDMAYDHMYVLPENAYGQMMLNVIQQKGWQKKITNLFLSEKEIKMSSGPSFLVDGYDPNTMVHSCVFCVPDLVKLKSMKYHAAKAEKPELFVVYCYDYQEEFVRSNLGDIATIKVVPFIDVMKRLEED